MIFVILLSSLLPLDLPSSPGRGAGGPSGLAPGQPGPPFRRTPVFAGTGSDTWDRKIRERGYILVGDDGTYPTLVHRLCRGPPAHHVAGLATSRDGIHWARDPENPIFAGSWVEDVCVVKRDGGTLHVRRGKKRRRPSLDLQRWSQMDRQRARSTSARPTALPLGAGPLRHAPPAWFENGTWFLFYERGDQGVWLATSKDMKIWKNVSDDPVLAMGPELYDKTAVAVNQIVKRDQHYYAFYHANAQRPWKDWTTCLARSRDLIHWEKYPGNPIIGDNCSSAILVRTPQGEDRLFTMHPTVKMFTPILSPAPAAKIESQ